MRNAAIQAPSVVANRTCHRRAAARWSGRSVIHATCVRGRSLGSAAIAGVWPDGRVAGRWTPIPAR
jgi:hypothetical protein